jgi:hypothetical protein
MKGFKIQIYSYEGNFLTKSATISFCTKIINHKAVHHVEIPAIIPLIVSATLSLNYPYLVW